MAEYDNPAGRLFTILTRFNAGRNRDLVGAWASALNVEPERVPYYLGKLNDLVDETRRAAVETGETMFEDVPRHLESLPGMIFPPGQAWVGPPVANLGPDELLMQALDMLSKYLHEHSPDAELPDEEHIAGLIDQVRELISDVSESEIDPHVKRLLLQRLLEVQEAIEHLDLGGAEAVRSAALSLGFTARMYEHAGGRKSTFDRVKKVAVVAYVMFLAGSPIHNAEVGWEHVFPDVIAAPAQVRALPAGAPQAEPPPADAH